MFLRFSKTLVLKRKRRKWSETIIIIFHRVTHFLGVSCGCESHKDLGCLMIPVNVQFIQESKTFHADVSEYLWLLSVTHLSVFFFHWHIQALLVLWGKQDWTSVFLVYSLVIHHLCACVCVRERERTVYSGIHECVCVCTCACMSIQERKSICVVYVCVHVHHDITILVDWAKNTKLLTYRVHDSKTILICQQVCVTLVSEPISSSCVTLWPSRSSQGLSMDVSEVSIAVRNIDFTDVSEISVGVSDLF